MIRTILEGRKTLTRRVMKPQPPQYLEGRPPWNINGDVWGWAATDGNVKVCHSEDTARCPYGAQGDRLWVRETWAVEQGKDKYAPPEILAGSCVWHYATAEEKHRGGEWRGKWRPSIHMPRWASRITLEVTGVRVERVQDISKADALAEGIEDMGNGCGRLETKRGVSYSTTRALFIRLWDSINAKRGYGWEANPFVWVVEFKRTQQDASGEGGGEGG